MMTSTKMMKQKWDKSYHYNIMQQKKIINPASHEIIIEWEQYKRYGIGFDWLLLVNGVYTANKLYGIHKVALQKYCWLTISRYISDTLTVLVIKK